MRNKLLSTFAVAMAATMAVPGVAFAASDLKDSTASTAADATKTADETMDGQDENQSKATVYSEEIKTDAPTNACEVYATQASTFSVIIPKTIILNGKKDEANTGAYVVTAKGNIGGAETIHVVPDASFKMSQEGKEDIDATVTQAKVNFVVAERADEKFAAGMTADNTAKGVDATDGATADGLVEVTNLSAGSWAGQFNFNIEIVTDDLTP